MKENKTNELEFSANEILKNMCRNTFNNFQTYDSSSINQNYLNLRNSIFNIIQKITMRFGFKSQTFFLTTYYLDIIFLKKKKININLYKLGLACLCLSSKFCENDPIVPQLQYFVKAYNGITGYKNFISMNELMHSEVIVCKILKYKLNYFTIYDFIAFFFCHGIFKFEQIREIQKEIDNNNNEKGSEFNKEEFELDTFFVKNILGKIYRTVRNYLDILIKIDKICMKYNPLYIAIYLIEKSMTECLEKEYKKCKGNLNKEEFIKDINKFSKKNKIYYKEIMNEFYKIHYENNEQYLQLITDNEINCIFVSEKKIIKKQVNENDNNKDNKNKLFNSTMTNGFYKRLNLQLNNDKSNDNDINKEKNNNIISKEIKKQEVIENNDNNLETEDDLNSNLNINQLRNTMNTKKPQISLTKKFHKISMNKINSFDKIETNKTFELKTEKTKPIKNMKFKVNLRNKETTLKFDTSLSFKTLESTKKPYSKKLPSGNNRNIIKSFNESLKSSTSTNFYSSKLKNITNTENNTELNKTTSYLKIFDKAKEKPRVINTAITKKYKKIVNNNNKDLSSKSLRSKKIFTEKKFDSKTFSATGENFYSSKPIFTKISVNKINSQKDSEIHNLNINKELRTKKLSSNFYKNNSSVNNTYKAANKISLKNYDNEYKMKINSNINKDENKDPINDKAQNYKKISYSKIHNDYIQAKSDKKKEIKRIIFKSKPNENAIKEGYSFKTLNSINKGPSNEKQFKTINKDLSLFSNNNNNSNIQSSGSTFYNFIQKTKQFFKKEKEINDPKKITNKNINSYKKVEPSKSFYTSQKNFYKKDNKVIDNNNKEKEINKGNTIIINNNININIGSKKDIKIPELNFNNTIVTSGQNNINLNNKFNTQRIKNNSDKSEINNKNEDNKATITFKNIFQKFHINKKIINKNNK